MVGVGRGADRRTHRLSPRGLDTRVRLWSDVGRPLAIVARNGRAVGLAVIPLCSCGDPGCTASGRQADAVIAANRVGSLLDRLGDLALVGKSSDGSELLDLSALVETEQRLPHPAVGDAFIVCELGGMYCHACEAEHSPFDEQHLPESSRFGVVEACVTCRTTKSRWRSSSGVSEAVGHAEWQSLSAYSIWSIRHNGTSTSTTGDCLCGRRWSGPRRGSWPTTQSEKPTKVEGSPSVRDLYVAAADAIRAELVQG